MVRGLPPPKRTPELIPPPYFGAGGGVASCEGPNLWSFSSLSTPPPYPPSPRGHWGDSWWWCVDTALKRGPVRQSIKKVGLGTLRRRSLRFWVFTWRFHGLAAFLNPSFLPTANYRFSDAKGNLIRISSRIEQVFIRLFTSEVACGHANTHTRTHIHIEKEKIYTQTPYRILGTGNLWY